MLCEELWDYFSGRDRAASHTFEFRFRSKVSHWALHGATPSPETKHTQNFRRRYMRVSLLGLDVPETDFRISDGQALHAWLRQGWGGEGGGVGYYIGGCACLI